ncbi:MAG: hypothetical protein AAGJ46_04665 [Planctomycetota bacterium]
MRGDAFRFSLGRLMAALAIAAVAAASLRSAAVALGARTVVAHLVVTPCVVGVVLLLGNRLQVGHRLPAWRVVLLFAVVMGLTVFVALCLGAVADVTLGFAFAIATGGGYAWFAPVCVAASCLAQAAYFVVYRRNIYRDIDD